jgi:hypothetical protein
MSWTPTDVAAACTAAGIVAAFLTKGWQWLRRVLRALDRLEAQAHVSAAATERIEEVTTRELEHNHGSSMKDDVHGVAVAVGVAQRDINDLRADVEILGDALRDHLDKQGKDRA